MSFFASIISKRICLLNIFYDLYIILPERILAIIFMSNFFVFHAENFITLFILLNRLTCILMPVRHKFVIFFSLKSDLKLFIFKNYTTFKIKKSWLFISLH